jgi:glycosyltransferase involved in cell wall biosynthesis
MIPVLYTTWNRLDYTKQTLPVLLETTHDGEIIIIDNGSMDGTDAFLYKFRSHRKIKKIIFNNENKGIGGAMNQFLELTKDNEFIAKVDDDTIVPTNWLNDLLDPLIGLDRDAVQANHYFFIQGIYNWEHLKREKGFIKFGLNHFVPILIGASGTVFKRNIFDVPIEYETHSLFGWSQYQSIIKKGKLKTGLYDGVWIELLDMKGVNAWDETSGHMSYRKLTGRFIERADYYEARG